MRILPKPSTRKYQTLLLIFVVYPYHIGSSLTNISVMTIAERIRLARMQKKFSQTQLAQLSGVNLKSLSRYELGSSVPPADALKAIADALAVSTDSLLSDEQRLIKDKDLLAKMEVIDQMDEETKQMVVRFLDLAVRDFKTRQAYAS